MSDPRLVAIPDETPTGGASPVAAGHASLSEGAAELRARLSPDSVLLVGEPLARRTTLRVGGPADFYLEPAHEGDLAAALAFCRERNWPWFLLGRGSNLLVRDGGVRGLVISLARPDFSAITREGDRLRCGAGARLKTVAVEARRWGLAGFEFLEGIPGSVGGALRMNAGAMGSAIFALVETVRFMDATGAVAERSAAEIPVTYRRCPFLTEHIALAAVLRGEQAEPDAIRARMETYSRRRWETQPPQPSAGCIFKNPPAIPAGRLIQELGLKGERIGGACVSSVHGNFIVNEGGATAVDMLALIERVRDRARQERGIELEVEVEIVGEP